MHKKRVNKVKKPTKFRRLTAGIFKAAPEKCISVNGL
jgi:hypothetical protein